jgi:uncharacterized protein YcaQ
MQRGTWWDWKPAKIALEILFEEGHLMIDRRVNFQRYYDLAERVLPASAEPPRLTVADWHRWATLESILRLGVATLPQIADYYRQPRPALQPVIEELLAAGQIVPAAVEGWQAPAYVAAADLPLLAELEDGGQPATVTALLSPFDNLIWDRRRVRDLFHFDFRLEVYAPLATRGRQWGYYVLPILRHGRLIGRLDPKADRRARTLLIHALYLEPDEFVNDELVADLAEALRAFAAFHECPTIRIARTEPAVLGEPLLRQLEQP